MTGPAFDFIHVGHHKCGSTFIQWEVLPRVRALRPLLYELHHIPANRANYEQLMYLIHCAEPFYDPKFLDPLRQNAAKANCLSFEGLVGHGTMEGPTGMGLEHTAARLRDVFGPTNILFVIRDQTSWLRSWYQDDLQFGFACGFAEWFAWRKEFHHLNWARYAPMIEVYRRRFGADKVRVVLFEDIFDREVFRELLESFDVDPAGLEDVGFTRGHNTGVCPGLLPACRFMNRRFGTALNRGAGPVYHLWRDRLAPALSRKLKSLGLGGKKDDLDFPGFTEQVRAFYHEDNQRTSEMIGRDLGQRGYP